MGWDWLGKEYGGEEARGGGDDGGGGDDDVNNNDGLGELGGYHILASAGADRLVKLWTCRK